MLHDGVLFFTSVICSSDELGYRGVNRLRAVGEDVKTEEA